MIRGIIAENFITVFSLRGYRRHNALPVKMQVKVKKKRWGSNTPYLRPSVFVVCSILYSGCLMLNLFTSVSNKK